MFMQFELPKIFQILTITILHSLLKPIIVENLVKCKVKTGKSLGFIIIAGVLVN